MAKTDALSECVACRICMVATPWSLKNTSGKTDHAHLSPVPLAGQLQQDLALPAQDGLLPLQAALLSLGHFSPGNLILCLRLTLILSFWVTPITPHAERSTDQ